MIKLMRFVAVIAIALSTLTGLAASAQNRTNTKTASANLHIQVYVVEVVMSNQNPKATPETAVSYSIPTTQPRMSVTKEIRKMQATGDKTLKTVEITTVVAE
jgi:Tfp pilus assembly protein PilE